MSEPVFAVVGHANPGKSSVVSTLSANDSVRIGPLPGTTRQCRHFQLQIGDQTLYTLVDTPGFERPRQVLAWLRQHETETAARRQAVEQFVRLHESSEPFRDECQLLGPILDGAAILYVVDGSIPPSPLNEAEMEILRWTGQPRMALINPVEQEDYSRAWRDILDQYFNLVRVFNAHEADIHRRLELLRALRELNDQWTEKLDAAISCLVENRKQRRRDSAGVITDMLVDMIAHTDQMHLPETGNTERIKSSLETRYYDWLRKRERRGHDTIKEIYEHHKLRIDANALQVVSDDLFSEATTNRLGLSKPQLVATSTAAGAVVGGAIDASVGAASLLLGTVLGGAAGAAAGYWSLKKLPKVVIGGDALRMGPMTNLPFPWIVLDRAILTHQALANRAHARRDDLSLGGNDTADGLVTHLPGELRKAVEACFAGLRKQGARPQPNRQAMDKIRRELTDHIEAVLDNVDQLPG